MFERILSFFDGGADYKPPMPEADANHAFGALLMRIAKADQSYLFQELKQIDDLLAKRFNLNPVEAAKFRAECEKLEAAMPDTAAFGEILIAEMDLADRETMFCGLWDVLIADGLRHEKEIDIANHVAQIFGISPTRVKELTKET